VGAAVIYGVKFARHVANKDAFPIVRFYALGLAGLDFVYTACINLGVVHEC